MKSPEKAYRKYIDPKNNSSSKMQFSFGKETRFKDKSACVSTSDINYYDLPSTRSKRAASFGVSERNTFKIKDSNPPPGRYNPH